MGASISVVCYKSKTLSTGECPLMIQISKDGRRKYQSLGISINPQYWDFTKNKPRPICPNRDYIQKIILDKIVDFQKQILGFNANQKEYTLTNLLENKKSSVKDKTVGEFFQELISDYKSTDKVGNRLVYQGSYNSLKTFSKGRLNLLFADIDVAWLNKYEKWLRAKGNKETSISLYFRTLRSAYNKAIEDKCASKGNYPFNDYKISKFDVKTSKRAIPKESVILIRTMDLNGESNTVQFARDIFVFSYFCGGINFTDICNLKHENIVDYRLQYTRQKTGKKISLPMRQEAIQIVNRYQQLSMNNGYLFPILKINIHKTALQKQNRIHKILVKVNIGLKRIALLSGINIALSTYSARHTFATVLKKSGVNISIISESLGHSDLSTTQIYLDSFDNEQIDSALQNLL